MKPAKILFLNNAMSPVSSRRWAFSSPINWVNPIFFLISKESRSGYGVLLAYMFFGRGSAKQSAGGAAIIHFLGVSLNLLPVCVDESASDPGRYPRRYDWRVHADYPGRWSGSASPGSILAVLAMTPRG
ncbi:hypothetical protein ACLB1Q_22860 [Escherichia coli]